MERINRLVEAIFIHLDCDNDPSQKELPCNQSEILIILLGVILGLSLRLSFLVNNDFPLNDGGMFYTMAKDLIANGFSLPVYTSYNQSQIPFAYPPLSIYFLAGIHQVTGIDLLRLLQYVPFAFNLASIPVVYGLVYRLTQSRRQAGLAALTYALIRPGYESFLYGGGLTRASSWLFALLTLERFVLSLKIPSFKNWMFVVLCLTLATACHLEIGWFTVFSMLVIYFFYARNLKSLIRLVVAGISFFLLLTPYWGSLLRNHGVGVFQNALQAGEFQPELSLFKLFVFNFTNEMLFQLFGVVAFVGLMACILSRKLFFPVWLVVITFLDPRSADRSASVVTSALVAAGMDQVIVPALMKISAWKSPLGQRMSQLPGSCSCGLW